MPDRHPQLWFVVTAAAMRLLGDRPFVWRLFPLLCGAGLVAAVYVLARKITGDALTARIAAFILTLDSLTMVLSRTAMLNVPMLLLMTLSFLAYLCADPKSGESSRPYFFSGLFLGLALATRWFAYLTAVLVGLCLLRDFFAIDGPARRRLARNVLVYYVGLVLLVYFSVHLVIPCLKGMTFADIWKIQLADFKFHTTKFPEHRYGSPWYSWPYMARPVWFYFRNSRRVTTAITTLGNPAVYWLMPAAALFLARMVVRRTDVRASGLVLTGLLASWLPYALIGRITFFHYFHTAAPFIAIGLAMLCARAWRRLPGGKVVVAAYLALVLALFAFWYPIQTAMRVPVTFYWAHTWFRTWV